MRRMPSGEDTMKLPNHEPVKSMPPSYIEIKETCSFWDDAKMSGWQPIGDAPRDGRGLLLGRWFQGKWVWWKSWWNGGEWENSEDKNPTHFHSVKLPWD
jgi:hypothetical protein